MHREEQKPPAEAGPRAGAPRWRERWQQEDGIATAEFSIVTLAAVGFAGLLVTILGSGEVKGMLVGLIRQAIGG